MASLNLCHHPFPAQIKNLGIKKGKKKKIRMFTIICPRICRVLPKAMKLSAWFLISLLCICALACVVHLLENLLWYSLLGFICFKKLEKPKLHLLNWTYWSSGYQLLEVFSVPSTSHTISVLKFSKPSTFAFSCFFGKSWKLLFKMSKFMLKNKGCNRIKVI